MNRTIMLLVAMLLGYALLPLHIYEAQAQSADPAKPILTERMQLFHDISILTGIPWNYLAAVDQYERSLAIANPKKRPLAKGSLIAIYYPEQDWVGAQNPDVEDTNPASIRFFGGIGLDGSGDGRIDRNDPVDVLYTMARHILKHGSSEDDFRVAIWEHYHNTRSVERIEQFSKIYKTFETLDLSKHAFPLPLRADYSYRSTWGAARSYGGYRIHEGTDIFARHGVPVRSTSYGVVEIKGWNRYGGWRIGIRDINNVYHYFAHLSGFQKGIEEGQVVKPGDIIGWVGSSGYGKPGTQGKFPPHLHYGVYRDNGYVEWSFDPYPYLRNWEREERRAKAK